MEPIKSVANILSDCTTELGHTEVSILKLHWENQNGQLVGTGTLYDDVLDPLNRAMRYAADQLYASLVDYDRCCLGA